MTPAYTLITGGMGGLGSAFAAECARLGRNLILVDRYPEADDLMAYFHQHYPVELRYIPCDLADHPSRQVLLEQIKAEGLTFNGLINVVGQEHEGPFLERTQEEVLHMVHLNLEAMLDLTLALLRLRDETQRFLLVNVASLGGFFPIPYKAVYTSTKRFVINFSLALRKEIEPFGNVTVLCPGGLPTNAESMKKIFLQGFWGKMTTQDTSVVVRKTMQKVQRNVPVYIPGVTSRLLVSLARVLPDRWLTGFLYRRWSPKQTSLELWRLTEKRRGKSSSP